MLEIQIFYLLKLLLCETHRGLSSIQAGKSVLQVHWSEQTKYYNLYRNMFSRTFTVWHTTYPHTHGSKSAGGVGILRIANFSAHSFGDDMNVQQ